MKPVSNGRRTMLGAIIVAGCLLSGCSDGEVNSSNLNATRSGTLSGSANDRLTLIEDDAEAQRFLAKATFGPTMEDIAALSRRDASEWVRQQFTVKPSPYLPRILALESAGENIKPRRHSALIWNDMISRDDQLRQRMTFALSQIIVVSDSDMFGYTPQYAYYIDTLQKNAFGNYRDLLEDITYAPAMAKYLTYFRNLKEDPKTGRMPDENYARELLQLFTIGLVELNMDGTPKLTNGQEVETFSNDDIQGLARVFTGMTLKGDNFWKAHEDGTYSRMVTSTEWHSSGEKAFLGTLIPAGTGPDETITQALDTIFAHPNVAPFVSKQLIQRFTASDPDPAYVERVATAFETGTFTAPNGIQFGTGERGDLKATLSAILLDPSIHVENGATPSHDGKVREPILKFANTLRAFDASPVKAEVEYKLDNTSSGFDSLAQHPMRSPSVFNFYRPGFVSPGTESGNAGKTAPEFQIVHSGTIVGYLNFTSRFILDRSPTRDKTESFTPDFRDEIALAETPSALVDHLDLLLTGKTLSEPIRQEIQSAIESIPLREGSEPDDMERRAQLAIFLVTSSSAFAVQK
ncbi:MAG: DUF1800 domain-containing protein [Hyphomonas sp.]